jgi:hypothetical protein
MRTESSDPVKLRWWPNSKPLGPGDFSDAEEFVSLQAALLAAMRPRWLPNVPWIRSGDRVLAPHEIEHLWSGAKERMAASRGSRPDN